MRTQNRSHPWCWRCLSPTRCCSVSCHTLSTSSAESEFFVVACSNWVCSTLRLCRAALLAAGRPAHQRGPIPPLTAPVFLVASATLPQIARGLALPHDFLQWRGRLSMKGRSGAGAAGCSGGRRGAAGPDAPLTARHFAALVRTGGQRRASREAGRRQKKSWGKANPRAI